MNLIKSFNEWSVNEEWEDIIPEVKRNSAGVAILYNNKILLVHPTGSSWHRGTCGIPKGGIELDEDPMDAAIRELREETGIILSHDDLDPEPQVVYFYSKNGKKVDKQLIYFISRIDDLSKIQLESVHVPKQQLQLSEIDWAKFVSAEEAYPITSRTQLIILDRLLNLL